MKSLVKKFSASLLGSEKMKEKVLFYEATFFFAQNAKEVTSCTAESNVWNMKPHMLAFYIQTLVGEASFPIELVSQTAPELSPIR